MLKRRLLRQMHWAGFGSLAAAAVVLTSLPAAAPALARKAPVKSAPKAASKAPPKPVVQGSDVAAFYRARKYDPLWIQNGRIRPEADQMVQLLRTAEADGLKSGRYKPRAVAAAIARSRSGSLDDLGKAEMLLSQTFAAYVRDVRRPRKVGMVYVDASLAPAMPSPRAALEAAASAKSLSAYLQAIGWMNPLYGDLRRTLALAREGKGPRMSRAQEKLVRVNLERASALPATTPRYVLIDAAAARLLYFENGKVRGSMKVVVGRPNEQTPMMAAKIRYASVNPYWNVPPDLVRTRIAPNVLSKGLPYLKEKKYQILSDWSDNAKPVSPAKIDWQAVASGRQELAMRQLPGTANSMGKMKFMFPNAQGIYLHDTPGKDLFGKDERRLSAGCIRLENAPELARLLFRKPLKPRSGKPEQRINLPEPVPIYITYLTAAPEAGQIVYRADPYGRDRQQFAQLKKSKPPKSSV